MDSGSTDDLQLFKDFSTSLKFIGLIEFEGLVRIVLVSISLIGFKAISLANAEISAAENPSVL